MCRSERCAARSSRSPRSRSSASNIDFEYSVLNFDRVVETTGGVEASDDRESSNDASSRSRGVSQHVSIVTESETKETRPEMRVKRETPISILSRWGQALIGVLLLAEMRDLISCHPALAPSCPAFLEKKSPSVKESRRGSRETEITPLREKKKGACVLGRARAKDDPPLAAPLISRAVDGSGTTSVHHIGVDDGDKPFGAERWTVPDRSQRHTTQRPHFKFA